jgi:hypothetical protein
MEVTKMVKLIAFVGCLGSFVAVGQSAWAQNGPPAHCCVEASETTPGSASAATCGGTRWSKAHPGYCATTQPRKDGYPVCAMEGSQALVVVHEFTLTWDNVEGQCRLSATGEKGTVQVATCDGSAC